MKSMRSPSAAIFFMTYFHRARGGHGPLGPPPGSATAYFNVSFPTLFSAINLVRLETKTPETKWFMNGLDLKASHFSQPSIWYGWKLKHQKQKIMQLYGLEWFMNGLDLKTVSNKSLFRWVLGSSSAHIANTIIVVTYVSCRIISIISYTIVDNTTNLYMHIDLWYLKVL